MNGLFEQTHSKLKICNDVIWLLFFIILWVVLLVIAAFAIYHGNYLVILNGYDSYGNICGVKHNRRFENFSLSGTDTSLKPYTLFLADLRYLPNMIKICVEECPTEFLKSFSAMANYEKECETHFCRYDFDVKSMFAGTGTYFADGLGPCADVIVPQSFPVRHVCVYLYMLRSVMTKEAYFNYGFDKAQSAFTYIFVARYYIAGLIGVGIVASMGAVLLIYYLKTIVPWLICSLVTGACAGLCSSMWIVYSSIDPGPGGTSMDIKVDYFFLVEDLRLNLRVLYKVSIISSVLMVLIVCVVAFMGKGLTKSRNLLEEAMNCLKELPELVWHVSIALLALIGFLTFWTYVMLCIGTANYPEVKQLNVNTSAIKNYVMHKNYMSFERIEYVEAKTIRNLYWPFLLSLPWTVEFIFAWQRFFMAAVVIQWYFKGLTNPSDQRHSLGSLLIRHLGSLVKGSLLITILRIPRMVLIGIRKGLEKCLNSNQLNFFGSFCGVWTCRAYSMMAMENADFSSAVRMAFESQKTIPDETLDIRNMTFLLLFLVKLFVASLTCLLGIFLLKDYEDLYFYMAPVLFSTVLGFLVAHTLMLALEVTADTLLLCIVEDSKVNGNTDCLIRGYLSKFLENDSKILKESRNKLFVINSTNHQVSDSNGKI